MGTASILIRMRETLEPIAQNKNATDITRKSGSVRSPKYIVIPMPGNTMHHGIRREPFPADHRSAKARRHLLR